tara:strand:- start:300 stop:2192 length:1893 start_codon:yes stop_codon:yes gene_type:complete
MAEERGLQSLVSPETVAAPEQEAEAEKSVGEIISDVYQGMSDYDKAALFTAPIPVVGDIVGAVADTRALVKDPSLANLGFLAAGLLPFVPSGGIRRAARDLQKQKAFTNLRNFVPGFYGSGVTKAQQVAAYGRTIPEGLANIAKARYDPKSRALQNELNISVADRKTARQALKVSETLDPQIKANTKRLEEMKKEGTAYVPGEFRTYEGKKNPVKTPEFTKLENETRALRTQANDAGKKAMGQLNQSRSMTKQFFGADTGLQGLLKNFDKVDHIKTFDNFNETDYFKTVGDLIPKQIGREGVDEIFKQIRTLPAIGFNPNRKYQMNIRRVATGSAGELNPGMKAKLYSGQSLQDIKNTVFSEEVVKRVKNPKTGRLKKKTKLVPKKYTSDDEFLQSLKSSGLRVLNEDAVLKGKPAILTGSAKTDAYELGGANYMTAISKDGKVTTILNDEHDLLGQTIKVGSEVDPVLRDAKGFARSDFAGGLSPSGQVKSFEVGKLPGADRYMNVSEPMTYDLFKTKKLTKKQKDFQDKLKKEKDEASAAAIKEYEKIPGVDVSGKLPEGFKTREQWARAQAVAKAQPTQKDYTRVVTEAAFIPSRVARPAFRSEEENKKGGGSVVERNPNNYEPKAI